MKLFNRNRVETGNGLPDFSGEVDEQFHTVEELEFLADGYREAENHGDAARMLAVASDISFRDRRYARAVQLLRESGNSEYLAGHFSEAGDRWYEAYQIEKAAMGPRPAGFGSGDGA
jgi:hypothetical protein